MASKAECVVIDVGNTSTSVGHWDGHRVSRIAAVRGGVSKADEIAAALDRAGARTAHAAIVASVVPGDDDRWRWLLKRLYSIRAEFLTSDTPLPISIDYPAPAQIGADRLCDAVGAAARHGAPVAVADFGTALTFDVIDSRNAYIGGLIAPGLPLMTGYMHEKTSKLPLVDLGCGELPEWGDSTEHAMALGAWHAHRGMVRQFVEFIRARTGPDTTICATGGYAAWALKGFAGISVEPDLTLFGLGTIRNFARGIRTSQATSR